MAKAMTFFLVLLLVSPAAYEATQHTVGGPTGWTTGIGASNWATRQNFTVGDTLLFNYGSSHAVVVVSGMDFSNCISSNPIESYSQGPTTITLNASGPWYILCPRSSHCREGQRLYLNVVEEGISTTPPRKPPPSAAGKLGCGGFMLFVLMSIVGLIMG